MIPVPIEPFLPTHEEILEALAAPGAVYLCADPDERWAPYVGAMRDAGWLSVSDGLVFQFEITDAGRQRLELQRLGET